MRQNKEGGAAEARTFRSDLTAGLGSNKLEIVSSWNEEQLSHKGGRAASFCVICLADDPELKAWGRCGPGCTAHFCSLKCFNVHKRQFCRAVGIVDLGSTSLLG